MAHADYSAKETSDAMIFAFVANTNLFSDAHLVSITAVGYKAESRIYTPGCCGFCTHETTASWGEIMLYLEDGFPSRSE